MTKAEVKEEYTYSPKGSDVMITAAIRAAFTDFAGKHNEPITIAVNPVDKMLGNVTAIVTVAEALKLTVIEDPGVKKGQFLLM